MEEKQISSQEIYNGKIMKVYKDKVAIGDKEAYREYVSHNGGACILAEENGYIYFVKQFRYAYRDYVLELPAGKVEIGEKAIDCAAREITEETGLIASNIIDCGYMYPSPGYTNEKIYLFIGENLKHGETHFDDDEDLDTIKIKVEDVKKMLLNNEIKDAKSMILLYKYFDLKK